MRLWDVRGGGWATEQAVDDVTAILAETGRGRPRDIWVSGSL